jgi:outer membrane lipoprotein-sorting protein
LWFIRETRDRARKLVFLFVFFGVFRGPFSCVAAEQSALWSDWLCAQTNLQTWSADVIQTRTLKTLAQPLVAQGHVWFSAPNRFRWELTSPSPTIALRQPEQMLVIYPKLKRAERYPLNGAQAGPWKDSLVLLEAGFPRSAAEIESRFDVLSQTVSNALLEVALQPKSPAARRLMPQIKISVATNDFALRATELQFADGSTMRNDFSNAQLNPKLADGLFTPKLEGDFKVVEPAKGVR